MTLAPDRFQGALAIGAAFLAFQQACQDLHLFIDLETDAFLQQVRADELYPFEKLDDMFRIYEKKYTDPSPIFEHIGQAFFPIIFRTREMGSILKDGYAFLEANRHSQLYHGLSQGSPDIIGTVELTHLSPAEGRATIVSTTPFSRDFERGILLGGLQVTQTFDYVDVDNSADPNVFEITMVAVDGPDSEPTCDLAAKDFLDRDELDATARLSGRDLQKVFWRHKTLEQELRRQKALWEATNKTLCDAFLQVRDQERQLQQTNAQLTRAYDTSERLKTSILDAALDAIISIDEIGAIIEFNPTAERIFGYRRSDVLGRPISEVIIPPHLRQRHQDGMQRYRDTGLSQMINQRIEIEAMHADGHYFPVELAVTNTQLAHQRVFTAYLRDITERQRMEQALRDSEQRFRTLVEACPVPVGIVARGQVKWLYVSKDLADFVGTTVDDLTQSDPNQIFESSDELNRFRQRLDHQGAIDVFEFTMRKYDGSTVPVAMTAKRITFDGNDATVGGFIDLSEQKRAEDEIAKQREALYQSEKLSALGSLLAGIAHELNNPLSVVVGRAIMLTESTHDAATRSTAERIRLAAERCTRIVKTFLAIARQESPERVPVQINEVIESALDLVIYSLRTAGIEIGLDLGDELPELSADAVQLQQVFTNLLVNAQQALLENPEPRRVRIVTRMDAALNYLYVTVEDNGPGIPAAIRSRIFEPFYTTKPVGSGTGVGLALSHSIITAHGGTIELENPPQGGARFVITLPLTLPEPAAPLVDDAGPLETAAYSILIVDDEPEVGDMLHEILTGAGHRATSVLSGNLALAQLADTRYDLILSDLQMPDLNGPDFYEQLQALHPYLLQRIAFITGDTLGSKTRQFLQHTGSPYLEKPFTPTEVLDLVQRLMGSGAV